MITALISGLFGAFNALLPDVMGFFKKKQEMAERAADRAHEIAMLEKTSEIQVKLGAQKMDEARLGGELAAMTAEIKGQFEQLTAIYEAQKPIGVQWVDAWNAAMRPAAVSMILFVFGLGIVMYEVSTLMLWLDGKIPAADILDAMFKGLVGESIQAVLGYLFGYRGTNSARSYVQSRA